MIWFPEIRTGDRRGLLRRLALSITVAFGVAASGVAAFYFIEGWTLLESVYMVVITLTTVGFGAPRDLTESGTLISILIIVVGVSAALYSLAQFGKYVVAGVFLGDLQRRRIRRRVNRLQNHTIICGFGRLGSELALQLGRSNLPVVVVDMDPDTADRARAAGYLTVIGDASDDQVLDEAGIEAAANLVAAVGSDSINAFVTLSARALKPGLHIVARAESAEATKKLLRAGADDAVTPYHAGSQAIASRLNSPLVARVVDALVDDEIGPISMKQRVHEHSRLVGLSVGELLHDSEAKLQVLALGKDLADVQLLPEERSKIGPGDLIVAVGSPDSLSAVSRAADDR